MKRMRTQEMYRQKAAARHRPKPQPSSKALQFLNSNFGLFLLSSVFLTLFSWGYHQYTSYVNEKHEAEKAYQKLSLEVMNRLHYVDKLATTFQYDERRVIRESLFGFEPAANVNPSWIPHYGAMFPEYEQRSLVSLLWELESLSNPQRRADLKAVRERIGLIEPFFDKLHYSEVDNPGKGPDKKLGLFTLNEEDRTQLKLAVLDPLKFLEQPEYFSKH